MRFELDPRLKPFTVAIWLGAGLLLLIVVILIEWFAFRHSLSQDKKSSRTPNPQTLGAAVSLEGLVLPAVSEFSETVERPLFMETRRPSPPALPGPVKKSEPPAPVTFQLMGVLESPRGRLALIADSKGKYRKLREKDSIDGWEIIQIRTDRIQLQNQGMEENLNLVKKRPKTAGQQPHQKQPPQNQDHLQPETANQQQTPQTPQTQVLPERDPKAPPIGWPQAEEVIDEN